MARLEAQIFCLLTYSACGSAPFNYSFIYRLLPPTCPVVYVKGHLLFTKATKDLRKHHFSMFTWHKNEHVSEDQSGCEDISLTRDTQTSPSTDMSSSTYREYESQPRVLVPPVLSGVFPGVFRVQRRLTGKRGARPLGSPPPLPQTATAVLQPRHRSAFKRHVATLQSPVNKNQSLLKSST